MENIIYIIIDTRQTQTGNMFRLGKCIRQNMNNEKLFSLL